MSTRGLIGIRFQKQDFLAYNHGDSYPSQLGRGFFLAVKELGAPRLIEHAKLLRPVEDDDRPTRTDIKLMKELGLFEEFKASVNELDPTKSETWYAILRDVQGDLRSQVAQGIPWWIDYDGFQHSTSCQWAYVANLDELTVEVYVCNAKAKHRPRLPVKGRFCEAAAAVKDPDVGKYDTATLLESISFAELNALPDYAIEKWCVRTTSKF